VLSSPSERIVWKIGTSSVTSGNMLEATMQVRISWRRLRFRRAIAYAASEATTSERIVESTATARLLPRYRSSGWSVNACT